MKISMIAVIGKKRELGKNNKLLWHIPEDMKHFKNTTSGHVVIMGRKTFESIGKPLPNRTNIVVTNNKNYKAQGCQVAYSIEEAINFAKQNDTSKYPEIFIIGGGQLYSQGIKYADKLYLTIVNQEATADTYFPDYSNFKIVSGGKNMQSGNYTYKFIELEKH